MQILKNRFTHFATLIVFLSTVVVVSNANAKKKRMPKSKTALTKAEKATLAKAQVKLSTIIKQRGNKKLNKDKARKARKLAKKLRMLAEAKRAAAQKLLEAAGKFNGQADKQSNLALAHELATGQKTANRIRAEQMRDKIAAIRARMERFKVELTMLREERASLNDAKQEMCEMAYALENSSDSAAATKAQAACDQLRAEGMALTKRIQELMLKLREMNIQISKLQKQVNELD